MRAARLASLALLSLIWLATLSSARAETIALVVNGEPAKQPIVENALEPWLKGRQLDVSVGIKDAAVISKLAECVVVREPTCAEEAVGTLPFDYTLYVQVDAKLVAGADKIDLTGWLYKGNKFVAAQIQVCRDCRNDTLGPTAEDMAKALFAVQAQGTGRVAVTSTPQGAKVTIDGAVVGATPWDQGLRDGPHEIVIELPGYQRFTRTVEVKRDDLIAVDAVLVAEGASGGGGGGGKRNPLWLGVAGAGAAAIVGGAILIAIDEDADSVPVTQREFRDSALPGAVLVGVGVAAAAAGAYLYLTSGKPATRTPTAWFDPGGGAGVGLAGVF